MKEKSLILLDTTTKYIETKLITSLFWLLIRWLRKLLIILHEVRGWSTCQVHSVPLQTYQIDINRLSKISFITRYVFFVFWLLTIHVSDEVIFSCFQIILMDESSWIKRLVSKKHNILLVIVLSGMVFNFIYMTKYADLYSTRRYVINNTVSTSNIFITEVTQEPLLKRRAVRWMLHINSNFNISRVDEQKPIFREGKVVWMDPPGKFVNRISSYNDALNLLRTKLVQQIHLPWRDLEERITIVKGYMEETVFLAANTKLYTLVLKRRDITGQPGNSSCHNDQSNYLVHNYFMSSSTPPYCHYIRQHARQKNANVTGLALYACNEDINKSLKAECLKPVDMYSRSLIITHSEPASTFAKYFHDYFPEYIFMYCTTVLWALMVTCLQVLLQL